MKTKNNFIICLLLLTSAVFAQKDSTVKFSAISIDTLGNFKWTISYYGGDFFLAVEQKKNGKWIMIEEHGSGKPKFSKSEVVLPSSYKVLQDCTIVKFHKGLNIYRLRMTKPYATNSAEISLTSKVSNDEGVWFLGNKILLDNKTYYEILDQHGDIITKGEEKTIDISSLGPGVYSLYTKTITIPFTR